MGGERDEGWKKNSGIPDNKQINIWSGSYNVNVGSTDSEGYSNKSNYYSRGHQIADADRSGITEMQEQTYLATNSTPQIQNGFNGGIWSSLEVAVRTVASATDTVYVVTGPTYQTVGGSEEVIKILPKHDTKQCPVPNYYWKVLLKVKRNGQKEITSASAIGFWLEHKVYQSDTYTNYVKSVDEIERLTGFDFFVNLPDNIETTAEANTSWNAFSSF